MINEEASFHIHYFLHYWGFLLPFPTFMFKLSFFIAVYFLLAFKYPFIKKQSTSHFYLVIALCNILFLKILSSHCCSYALTLLAFFSMHVFLNSIMKVINASTNVSNRLKRFKIIAQSLDVNFRSWRLPTVPSQVTLSHVLSKTWELNSSRQVEKLCYFPSLLKGKVWTYFIRAHHLDQNRLITLSINWNLTL